MHKENNNNMIYSAILLTELPFSAILESTPERNQHCLRSVDSARMLNSKQGSLHWLHSGVLSKIAEDGNSRWIVE